MAVDPDVLAGLPLIQGAAGRELAAVADCLDAGWAAPGEVLGREGEHGDVFWLLTAGQVAVTMAGRHLADAGPGSVLGELALLRHQPRSATVTAIGECRFLYGREPALDRLLAIEPVRSRLRRLASARLAEDLRPVPARLRDGTAVLLRPLLPSDRAALDDAIHALSVETIRRRFFSAAAPPATLVDYLIDIDYVNHFAWIATEPETGQWLGAARYVRRPGDPDAELAFTTGDPYQGRGVGTFMLGALGVTAIEAGISTLVAHVLEDNVAMRRVFAKAGGSTRFDEPGVVFVTVEPARAAGLLDPEAGDRIAEAVRDVVTAASLALRR